MCVCVCVCVFVGGDIIGKGDFTPLEKMRVRGGGGIRGQEKVRSICLGLFSHLVKTSSEKVRARVGVR